MLRCKRGANDRGRLHRLECHLVRRRRSRNDREDRILATFHFHGADCKLMEDYSHIWGRSFEHEENQILHHFENLLREWAAKGDTTRLNAALDRSATRNRTSLMWTLFLEVGAEQTHSLGAMLRSVLDEPLFLTHPDYAYGGTALLGALHKTGDASQRESLERLVLELPVNASARSGDGLALTRPQVEHARDRLLRVLHEPNIVLQALRDLRRQRQSAESLPKNLDTEPPRVISRRISDKESVALRGINLDEPANEEMFQLREALKPLVRLENNKLDIREVERKWEVIHRCELALEQHAAQQPKMTQELRGYLVSACENIVSQITVWPASSERWQTIRRAIRKR